MSCQVSISIEKEVSSAPEQRPGRKDKDKEFSFTGNEDLEVTHFLTFFKKGG